MCLFVNFEISFPNLLNLMHREFFYVTSAYARYLIIYSILLIFSEYLGHEPPTPGPRPSCNYLTIQSLYT